jgi:hypothetical protein
LWPGRSTSRKRLFFSLQVELQDDIRGQRHPPTLINFFFINVELQIFFTEKKGRKAWGFGEEKAESK